MHALDRRRTHRPRWRILAALATAGLALLGWRLAVLTLERVSVPEVQPAAMACPGVLDSAFAAPVRRARAHLLALLDERRIPGLTVAVTVRGSLVWSEGFGLADREERLPACPPMQFRSQSVAKLITAAAMVRLVERGVLDLDAPIRTWLPDLPSALGTVSARQLASHRAGVRHYHDDNESLNTTRYETATASLEKFRDDPTLFPPDQGSAYSSYGFVLLSAAMEGATRVDFPTLLAREVFQPLAMAGTEAERAGHRSRERGTFYDHVTPYSPDGSVRRSPELDFSSKWAGGGILSTAEDLARFGAAHIVPFNRGFLTDSTVTLLFTPRTTQFLIFGQGLAWHLARDHRARRVRLHFGAGSGGSAILAVYPERQVSIALLANLGHAGFPMRRLLAITHPFVGDRLAAPAWLAGIGCLALAVIMLWRAMTRLRRMG